MYEDLLEKEGLLVYEFTDFSGGLNTKATRVAGQIESDFSLKRNQLVENRNWEYDESGGLNRRRGYEKLLSTGIGAGLVVHTLFEMTQANGSRFLIIGAGLKLYVYNTITEVADLLYTATTSNPWSFTVMNDLLVGVNGADDPVQFDGVTMTLLGGPLPATCVAIVEHRNRLFAASQISLFYSALSAPSDWTTPGNAGTLPLPVGLRSYAATFLAPMYNRLIIGMNEGLALLFGTGPDDFEVAPLSQYQGGLNQHSWSTVGDDIHYLSERGIHSLRSTEAQSLFGDVKQAYVSNIIEPTFREFPVSRLNQMVVVNRRNKSQLIWIGSKGGNTKNSEALVFDYFHGAWTVFNNFPFASAVQAFVGGKEETLLGGYNGEVYVYGNAATDDGADISAVARYHTHMEDITLVKDFRKLQLIFGATRTTYSVSSRFDFGARSTISKLVTIQPGNVLPLTLPFTLGGTNSEMVTISNLGWGTYIEITIRHTSSDATAAFRGGVIYAEPRRHAHA
jgi:hypothetical protein